MEYQVSSIYRYVPVLYGIFLSSTIGIIIIFFLEYSK